MKSWDYLNSYEIQKRNKKSANTVNAYIADLMQFKAYFNNDLELLNDSAIDDYKGYLLTTINKRTQKTLEPKTVNRKLVSIRQYIEWLNTNTDIKVFVNIELIKIQHQEYLDEILTLSEFNRLVKMAERENDLRAVAIFYTLYLTGTRVSEMLQLKVSCLSMEKVFVIGKGSKFRRIPFPQKLTPYLMDYIKFRKIQANQNLFLNETNDNVMSRVSVHKLIKKYAGRCKIKLSHAHAHSFRHLCALRLIEKGATVDEVADLLGHSNINTTRIYTRKTYKELTSISERL